MITNYLMFYFILLTNNDRELIIHLVNHIVIDDCVLDYKFHYMHSFMKFVNAR